jgi:hypothetical protein
MLAFSAYSRPVAPPSRADTKMAAIDDLKAIAKEQVRFFLLPCFTTC